MKTDKRLKFDEALPDTEAIHYRLFSICRDATLNAQSGDKVQQARWCVLIAK